MASRWSVDIEHAERVEKAAVACYERLATTWHLDHEDHLNMLRWAARTHELGLSISHGQYHKHGAYVAANADLAGFSRNEQQILATLIRGHRRKFPASAFQQLTGDSVGPTTRLCVLLRLAVLMQRGREDIMPEEFELDAEGNRVVFRLPATWVSTHPLTWADLEQEKRNLRSANIDLVVEEY